MHDLKQRLINILAERSLERGSFTLSSGQQSAYYIDARRTTMSAEGARLIGMLGHRVILERAWQPDSVGGLTLGADPVALAIARQSIGTDLPVDAFSVRKATKEHGTRRRIEGCFEPGHAVVVVEDVITSGQSALKAIQAITGAGGEVRGVLAVVDRLEGGRQAIEARGHDVATLVTLADLGLSSSRE